MNYDGGVYLCKVIERNPGPSYHEGQMETGKITLAVTKTLAGPERTRLVLPYSFAKTVFKGANELVWPNLDEIGGDSLVCTVNRGVTDTTAPQIPGIDEAASMVIAVKNPEDPKFQEIQLLCDLYKKLKAGNDSQVLMTALKEHTREVRAFVMQAVFSELGKTNPNQALAILKAEAPQWADASMTPEGEQFVSYIEAHAAEVASQVQAGEFAARCLAVVIAAAPAEDVRRHATRLLKFIADSFTGRPEFNLATALAPDEKSALIKALTEEANATPEAAKIRSLLTSPPTTEK